MKIKNTRVNRIILPFLLSAIMIVEPIGISVTVHAEEVEQAIVQEDSGQSAEIDVDDTLADGAEGIGQDTDNVEETDSEQDGGREDGAGAEMEEEEDENSSTEDMDNQGETSEDSSETEESEDSGPEADDAEELPEEELTDEELSDEELSDETGTAADEESEEESEADAEIDSTKVEVLNDFAGMPDGFRLTSAQKAEKKLLADHTSHLNEADEGILYVKGEIMALADSKEEAEMIASAFNAEIESFESGLLVMALDTDTSVATAIKAASSANTLLPAVWPNYYRHVHMEEGDTFLLESYEEAINAYSDPFLSPASNQYQWQHATVGSAYAWKYNYTGEGVKVAVLDSGVSSHEDLSIAGDYNYASVNSNSAGDGLGHGTHVAGIIGAQDNDKGGVGIAPAATLYNVKVIGDDGSGDDADLIRGLDQAVELDVDVINMSLGGPGYNDLLQQKVTEAYNAGIAVFASAGNDGVSAINYPACCDHVICVAATDTNNGRAVFSTYGSWVDLSAPGVNIWSTYNDSTSGYESLSGTSMACPVASGEAAVILSSYDSLRQMTKNGAKVDALEELMKENAIEVGSGMGAGVASLTKVFNLSTAAMKPNAPDITIVPVSESTEPYMLVTITAQNGTDVYYTTNGKNPSFKNGEADAKTETKLYISGEKIEIKGSNKATIKAIAVNEGGVSSSVSSATHTLNPYVTCIEISGVQKVAKGKKIQLTAMVSPTFAVNKKVDWTLQDADAARENGVTINSSGKVTAAKEAKEGKYTVIATAKDNGGVSGTYEITVIDAVKVGSVKFGKKSLSVNLPAVTQIPLLIDGEFEAAFNDADKTPADAFNFIWSSSNKSVAEVDQQGKVIPHKAGKVTITALANDSSGKKASCTITIMQLAEEVTVAGPVSVAVSKTAAFKATVMPTNTNNKKVTWQLYDKDKRLVDAVLAREIGVSVTSGGKVKATKNAIPGKYTVRAIAKDRGTIYGETVVEVNDGIINKLALTDRKQSKITLYRKDPATGKPQELCVEVSIQGKDNGKTPNLDAYSVTNSTPGIATVTRNSRNGNTIRLTIAPTGKAVGKTKFTVASTDGSNKKVTCTVTVVNPVSRIHIASNTITASSGANGMCVVRGKSIQLKATLESDGAVSKTGVTWSIDAPKNSGVKISSSGKVSASKQADAGQIYKVTATAKDGSGVSASYQVEVVSPATYVYAKGWNADSWVINEIGQMPDVDGLQRYVLFTIYSDVMGGYVEALSSNKEVIEVTTYRNLLVVTPRKAGTAEIVLRTTDGSGTQVIYHVRVTDEVL